MNDNERSEALELLARLGATSAHEAILNGPRVSPVPTPEGGTQSPTLAEMIGIAVKASLDRLEANGFIKFTPPAEEYLYRP